MGSQAARSVELLRGRGFFVEKVEQIVHGTFIKRDCFGAFDLIAVQAGIKGVLGVQVCASDRLADHVAKLKEIEAVWAWLRSGNHIVVHSWRKRRERHAISRKWSAPRWAVVEIPIREKELEPEPFWPVIRERIRVEAEARKKASLEKRRSTLARKASAQAGAVPPAPAVVG